ncbi:MAG: hypothetical protein AAB550_02295 [Patescibacteria group bacterium]
MRPIKLIINGIFFLLLIGGAVLLATNHFGRAGEVLTGAYLVAFFVLIINVFTRTSKFTEPSVINKNHYLLTLIILGFVFWRILFTNYVNLGHDSNFFSNQVMVNLSIWPSTWESILGGVDLGHNQLRSMWMQPLLIGLAALFRLGLTFPLLVKLLTGLQLIVGVWGVFKLLSRMGLPSWLHSLGAIFYFTNTYYLVNMDGGLVYLCFAYALFPLAVYTIFTTKNFIYSCLVWLVISFFDARSLFVLALISGVNRLIKPGLILTLILMVHGFWLIPAFFYHQNIVFNQIRTGDDFSFSSPAHTLFLSQPHWYSNIFGNIQSPRWYLVLLPIIVFLGLWQVKKSQSSWIFSIWILMGLFLVTGSIGPFGSIYTWLITNVPGFWIFRDPSKFTPILILGYMGMLCYGLEFIGNHLPKRLLQIGASILLISFAFPVILGKTTGAFSDNPLSQSFIALSNKLEQLPGFARILWLPEKPPLGVIGQTKIWTEAKELLTKRPFLSGVDGTYEYLNYIRSRSARDLFQATGIKYIIYPFPDERAQALKPEDRKYYFWQRDWLSSQTWLKNISSIPEVPVFEANYPVSEVYSLGQMAYVVGPDDTYEQAKLDLSQTGVVHLNNTQPLTDLDRLITQNSYLIFNRGDNLDLAMSQTTRSNFISLSDKVRSEKDPSGWWSRTQGNALFLKNYLLDRYGVFNNDVDFNLGHILAEGDQTLKLNYNFPDGHLFIRVLESSAGGSLRFVINDRELKLSTQSTDNVFRWRDLGQISDLNMITLESHGQINIINTLTVVPEDEYQKISNQLRLILAKNVSIQNKAIEVEYDRHSSTKYQFTINKAPVWIVLSQSYDPWWKVSGLNQKPTPVYDMLNAFYIEKPGTYTLEYDLQKYVYWGVILSLVGLVGIWIVNKYASQRIH